MTALQPRPGAVASLLSAISGATLRGSGGALTVDVPAAQLETAVHHLAAAGARLADLFAADGGQVTLRLVWGLDTERQYLVTETALDSPEYPPLSDIAPAAFTEECEIYEQFGVRPAGRKPLNRLVLPPHAGPDFPRLGQQPPEAPAEVHAPHTVAGQAFEFPFGPVRQAGVESLYYGLVTSGEEIVDLYLFTWHKHRGLEWRLRGRRPAEAMFLAERTEGLSATAVTWALAAAVESALGAGPPPGALLTRGIALELERLYNHAAAMAALCQSTGLSVGQAAAEIALERLLRVNAATFGHRYLFGVLDAGGVRRGPDQAALRDGLPGAYGELRRAADALLATNSFMDRLEATGIVSTEQARRLGLVGPVARAAGVPIDSRLDQPTAPYAAHPPALAVRDAGDVLARFRVMLDEAADASVAVLAAGGVVTFLVAWESMALLCYLLILRHPRRDAVAAGAFWFLALSETGFVLIIAAFVILATKTHTMELSLIAARAHLVSPAWRDTAYLLALAGFGFKAGLVPLHVWLPEAHPVAPADGSAFLSGLIVKLGVYGIVLFSFRLLPAQPAWTGLITMAVGALTAAIGILYAMNERDLKRFLAYSTIENIGIIITALGAGLIFGAYHQPALAAFLLLTGLYHVANHGTNKTLLFLEAGVIEHTTGPGTWTGSAA